MKNNQDKKEKVVGLIKSLLENRQPKEVQIFSLTLLSQKLSEIDAAKQQFVELKEITEKKITDLTVKLENEALTIKEFNQTVLQVLGDIQKMGGSMDAVHNEIKEFKNTELKLAKPEWYKEPKEEVTIKNVVKVETDNSGIAVIAAQFLTSLVDFLAKLSQKTFMVRKTPSDFLVPQSVILINPRTMKPITPEELTPVNALSINGIGSMGGSGIAQSVGIRGAGSIGDGTTTVTTAGTRVQLPSIECRRIFIQAHPSNAGDIVVGSSNVIAATDTRRGLALFSSQWQEFQVNNLNTLWIDATSSGDKINYLYEI